MTKRGVEYEYRVMDFARVTTRAQVRAELAAQAEYGHWELHRTRIYLGGRRQTWLRRRIIRAPSMRGARASAGPATSGSEQEPS